MSEADWITAGVLHERYLNDILHYVLRRVPREDEAEDITAEVFAAAFVALPRFRGHCPPLPLAALDRSPQDCGLAAPAVRAA